MVSDQVDFEVDGNEVREVDGDNDNECIDL